MSYTGIVRNGETGLPMAGITMSDGKHVTQTDARGAFSLPGWERARLVYANVLTKRHDDWYQQIIPENCCYDFCLYPAEAASGHSFLHISDTEISDATDDECIPWLEFIRHQGQAQGAAFLLHGGDICNETGLARHFRLMNYETMGFPVRYCIGNHDFSGSEFGESVYEQYYGPTWYSFDCANVHYVVTSISRGDHLSGYAPEDQWNWLLEDLKYKSPDKGLVLFNHGSCIGSFMSENDRKYEFRIDIDDREAILKSHKLLAVLFGHFHVQYHGLQNGYHFISSNNPRMGGIDASPTGMTLVHIDDNLCLSSRILYFDHRKYVPPEALWSTQLPGSVFHCTPLVYEDTLLAATGQDGWPKNCGIACLDREGKQLWFYPTGNSVKNNMAAENGRVYAQDVDGWVYALEAGTGQALWVTQVPLGTSRFEGRAGVVLYRGLLFAGNCRQLSALDPATGRILWSSAPRSAGENTQCRPVFWQDLVIMGSNWSGMYALDIHTGKEVWQLSDHRFLFFYATPLADGDRLIVPSRFGLGILDPANGAVLHWVELPQHCVDSSAQPVPDGDTLYISTVTNGVLALDRRTLQLRCHYPAGRCLTYSSGYSTNEDATVDAQVLTDGPCIHFAGSDGYLYTYEKQSGSLVQRRRIGAPSLTAPVRFGSGIATADLRGYITLFIY